VLCCPFCHGQHSVRIRKKNAMATATVFKFRPQLNFSFFKASIPWKVKRIQWAEQ